MTLVADVMEIGAAITAGAGAVNLTSNSIGTAITLGAGSSGLGLSSTEINHVSSSVTLTIGDIYHTGTVSTDGLLTLTITNPVLLQTRGANITLNNAVTTGGNLSLSTTGSSAATGIVSGSGPLTIGPGGGSSLSAAAAAGISLSNASNLAASVTLSNSTGGDILFYDNRAATISSAVNSASGGNLTIVIGTGALGIGTVTSTGTGYVSISSAGAATQSAVITAPGGLLLLGAGSFALDTQANVVSTLAASTSGTGAVVFNSSAALQVGSVNGTDGVTTAGGNVNLTTSSSSLTVAAAHIDGFRHRHPEPDGAASTCPMPALSLRRPMPRWASPAPSS